MLPRQRRRPRSGSDPAEVGLRQAAGVDLRARPAGEDPRRPAVQRPRHQPRPLPAGQEPGAGARRSQAAALPEELRQDLQGRNQVPGDVVRD